MITFDIEKQDNQAKMYVHQHTSWTHFHYDHSQLVTQLASVRNAQGRLLGSMAALGFSLQQETVLSTLTLDVLRSTEIEGEKLDKEQVRSSVARKLGIETSNTVHSSRNVEGVVDMMLDATQNYANRLTEERLFGWHAALFPTGYSSLHRIEVGKYRTGQMQVVSGAMGKEKVHFEAPEPQRVADEMNKFLDWINSDAPIDPVIKSAIAHFWFVTIHPFDDGNGRIARAIGDMMLARSDGSSQRFYSMSAEILVERKLYYSTLQSAQQGNNDLTEWIAWYIACLGRAIESSSNILSATLAKSNFWETNRQINFNDRQRKILNRMLDGFDGKLTTSKWAKINGCSADTALRDITDLIQKEILIKQDGGGRSTSYSLNASRG